MRKSKRRFSAISLDQAHEQCNALVKGDGGAVGLTSNPDALRRWMVAGPEISRILKEFDDQLPQSSSTYLHHDQIPRVQRHFKN